MQQLATARPSARWAPVQQRQCRRIAIAIPGSSGGKQQASRLARRHAAIAAASDPSFLLAAAPDLDLELDSFGQMQQAMRQFDRDMDSLFWGSRSPFAEAEREIDSALRRADEAAAALARREGSRQRTTTTSDDGRVRVERSETRAPGTYRYYERIEINGGGWGVPPPTTTTTAAAPPPLALLALLIAAGAYAALTAAFARNFDLTLYAARDKLRLALTWPLLLVTSRSFRAQFVSAVVRGERARVTPGVSPVAGVATAGDGAVPVALEGKGEGEVEGGQAGEGGQRQGS